MLQRCAVVCDFDGTITVDDLGDRISIHFAGFEHWRAEEDRYKSGAIPFCELLAGIFRPITATRDEIAAYARAIAEIRPGFERFVASCASHGWPFVVCSAGFDVYVRAVLESLDPTVAGYVSVRSNRSIFHGDRLEIVFDDRAAGCGRCGLCKRAVVDELHAAGYRVIFCGDGTSDRCGARMADEVFACGKLARFCEEDSVRCTGFRSFEELIARLFDVPPGAR